MKVEVVFDICFSFMRTFKLEWHELKENPSEFVRIALDSVDRQKLPVMKCQAAKFVEQIHDKFPDMIILTTQICLELLLHCSLKDNDASKYKLLN